MSDQTQDNSGEAIAGSSEPSMEDILASIRRIIAEDEGEEIEADISANTDSKSNTEPAAKVEEDSTLLILDEPIDALEDDFDPLDLEIPDVEITDSKSDTADLATDDDIMDAISEHEDLVIDSDILAVPEEARKPEPEPEPASEDDNIIDLVLDDIDLTDEEIADAKPVEIEETALDEVDDILIVETEDNASDDELVDLEDVIDLADTSAENSSAEAETDLVDEFLDIMVADEPEAASSDQSDVVDDISDLITADEDSEEVQIPKSDSDMMDEILEASTDAEADTGLDDIALDIVLDDMDEPALADEAEDGDILELAEAPEMTSSGDADIDLVKSLMADLTDTSFMDGDEAGLDFDMEKEDDAKFAEASDNAEAEQDALIDDILELAMDDEIGQSQLLDDLNATREMIKKDESPISSSSDEMFAAPDSGGTNALLEIANAAEADAEWAHMKLQEPPDETPADLTLEPESELDILPEPADTSDAAGMDEDIFDLLEDTIEPNLPDQAMAEAALVEDILDEFSEIETNDVEEIFDAEEQETPEMPKPAVNPDTILDEVTESAASDAFASLNQAVEEKTAAKEAGPAIGELVQDALRPMLKEWLDENLRDIVERAVQKEVKRISSGK